MALSGYIIKARQTARMLARHRIQVYETQTATTQCRADLAPARLAGGSRGIGAVGSSSGFYTWLLWKIFRRLSLPWERLI